MEQSLDWRLSLCRLKIQAKIYSAMYHRVGREFSGEKTAPVWDRGGVGWYMQVLL